MSKGVNVYDEVHYSFGSVNEAKEMETRRVGNKPCVFLSHRSLDKAAVVAIGDYIKESGVNIYLDINDKALQAADVAGDEVTVTKCIERGISFSTDVLALVSDKTQSSWWLPYELGYGKRAGKELACLKLKDLAKLPAFLSITRQLVNRQDLKKYVDDIRQRQPFFEVTEAARRRKPLEIRMMELLENIEINAKQPPADLANYLD